MDASFDSKADVEAADADRAARREANEAARLRLLNGPITRTHLVFALPILGANALQSLNLTIDQFWIARSLDVSAIAAAGNANVVMQLMFAAFMGMSGASNILIAQAVGAADWPMLKRVVGATTGFLLIASLIGAVGGLAFAPQIIRAVGTPAVSQAQAIIYLRILSLALPLLSFFTFIQVSQQSAGDSRRPFYFMLIAIGLNLVLNPLLIRGIGPFPPLGVAGSAVSTLVGQGVALTAMFILLYRRHSPIMLRREDLHHLWPDLEVLQALIVRGLPITGNAMVWQVSAAVMIGMVNAYGAVTAAAYTAASQVWNYMQMPAMALGGAATAMAAQNIGAGNWHRVDRIARSAVISALCLTGTISALLYLFGAHVLQVFLPSGSPAIQVALHLNREVLWSFALYSVTLQLIGIVRSTGAVWPATIVAFLALVCGRLVFAKLMLPYWGADAIWWSFPVGIALSVSLHSLYYRFGRWRQVQMLKTKPAVPPSVLSADNDELGREPILQATLESSSEPRV